MIDNLTKQLFLGIRKETGSMDHPPGCLSSLFKDIDLLPGTPEEKLLHRCSLITLFHAAASEPGTFTGNLTEPDQEDSRRQGNERANRVLREALARSWYSIVHEWACQADIHAIRPPYELMPSILNLAGSYRKSRRKLLAICGSRGRWLVRLNPAWQPLIMHGHDMDEIACEVSGEIWEEGTLAQRCEMLTAIRKKDPVKARDLLIRTLPVQNAASRSRLIESFATGLNADDEPMLESLLDDRSLEVRRKAASMLSLIPDSALASRMERRISACVKFEKGLLKRSIHVEPPQQTDDEMKRDSIPDKATAGLGLQASMLLRITALTPLSWWNETFRMLPLQLISMIRKTDWEQALITGLAEAAVTRQDRDWIIALLDAEDSKKVSLDRKALISGLSATDRESWVIRRLSPDQTHLIDHLLYDQEADFTFWSPETSLKILESLKMAIVRQTNDYTLRDRIRRTGFYIHPETLEQALPCWPENHPNWPYYNEIAMELFEIIKLRFDLYKELS